MQDYVDSMPDVGQDKTRISFHSFNKDAHTHILMNEPYVTLITLSFYLVSYYLSL